MPTLFLTVRLMCLNCIIKGAGSNSGGGEKGLHSQVGGCKDTAHQRIRGTADSGGECCEGYQRTPQTGSRGGCG